MDKIGVIIYDCALFRDSLPEASQRIPEMGHATFDTQFLIFHSDDTDTFTSV